MRYQIVHLRLAYFRTSQMQLSELIFSFTHTISFNRYKYHAWLMLLLHHGRRLKSPTMPTLQVQEELLITVTTNRVTAT
jgi:hypothetical protein